MAQQRHKELAGQGGADAAGGFARLQVRIPQNGQEIERPSAKGKSMNLAELQIARGIDPDKEKIGVVGMEGNEVSNIGLESSDLLATGVERMNQANLVSGFDASDVTRAQSQR